MLSLSPAISAPIGVNPRRMTRRGDWPWFAKIDAWLDSQKRRGLSPASGSSLSAVLGVSQPTVARWLRGETKKAPAEAIGRIAQLMGCSESYLMDEHAAFPPEDPDTSWRMLEAIIPEGEKRDLAPLLADPRGRRALLAYLRALGER